MFDKEGGCETADHEQMIQALYAQIGKLKVANYFLKKAAVKPLNERRMMIESEHKELSIVKQCKLVQVSRSGFYYEPAQESPENLNIMR